MVFHADDFDDVKEAELFLEKYPESEIFYEMVGYGVHFNHYLFNDKCFLFILGCREIQ